MISLLIRRFVPRDAEPAVIRRRYGYICGGAGIFFNLVLFLAKLIIGTASGSIAITADAFNNLSDATSSAVTLLGFLLASRKADSEHPFGHGRIEYVCGILISVVIIYVGITLLRSSVDKILHPEIFVFSPAVAIILVLSIAIKLYMAYYNRACSKKIQSATLRAAASDSLSDCISTGAVLLCALFCHFTGIQLDGYLGAVVSLLILWTGIRSVIETSSPLLGQAPDPDFVKKVEQIVRQNPETIGIHDLLIHDYGPSKVFVSLHMEVDGSHDLYVLHDAVDLTERRITAELGCEAVIHMDPIDVRNPVLRELFYQIQAKAKELCPASDIHDFRMVPGPTHTNLIFDLVLTPEDFPNRQSIMQALQQAVEEMEGNYFAVIKAEPSYCASAQK